MKIRYIHLILIILISGFIGYSVGVNELTLKWKNYRPSFSVINKQPPANIKTVDFALFWQVWQKIQEGYYDKKIVDPEKMYNGAISGMVASLDDPYTVFLPPTRNTDFKQELAGQFEGIGAELGLKDKQLIVVSPLDGSPAQKAGIKAGDAILKVNDKPTFGWTLGQAVEKIRGPKGTNVTLQIAHSVDSNPQTLKIVRDTITVKSVTGWVKQVNDIEHLSNGFKKTDSYASQRIAYIRLSQFGDHTNEEWVNVISSLQKDIQKDGNVKGIVLDLRNNPGGYLTEATFIASEFIKSGIVVYQDKGNGDKTPYPVVRSGNFTDIQLVVLINKGSASASEIVAGALRDHGRAKLVGDQSFGKGTIQTAEDLGNGAGLHVTIAKWLTPNETWVHEKGLTPDVKVVLDPIDPSHDVQLEKAIEQLIK